MPRTLSIDQLITKNALEQDLPWLFLFDLYLEDGTSLHFVNYPDEVLYDETTYSPYYLRMEPIVEQSDGTIPALKVSVSNVFREMEALLQEHSGLRGCKVRITVVNKGQPEIGDLRQEFVITESSSTATAAVFTLEKVVPALEVSLPGRSFTCEDFPGIQDRTGYW